MLEIVLHGEKLAEIGGFTITNTMAYSWMVTLIIVAVALVIRKRTALIPQRFQGAVELILGGAYDFMEETLGSAKKATKFFNYIATLFFFILINNWLALLPITSFGIKEGDTLVPLFRTTNSDLSHTLILAILSVVMIQVFGIMTIGFFKYARKFFINPFKDFI